MKPEAQRIAIAEACGWRRCETGTECWIAPDGNHSTNGRTTLPDYLSDLNAIMAAIRDIILGNEELEKRFLTELGTILDRRADDETTLIFEMEMAQITASADELSEALLRTIGKWTKD